MASPPLPSKPEGVRKSGRRAEEPGRRDSSSAKGDNSVLGYTQDGSFLVAKAKGKEVGSVGDRVKKVVDSHNSDTICCH